MLIRRSLRNQPGCNPLSPIVTGSANIDTAAKIFADQISKLQATASRLRGQRLVQNKFGFVGEVIGMMTPQVVWKRSCRRWLCSVLTIFLLLSNVAAQRRSTPKTAAQEPETQQLVTFDTLLAVDSYKIYGEVRSIGQLIRSEGSKELLDPVMKLTAPPKEFRSLVNWLNARADLLVNSRLLFAAWPSRPKLPDVLVALEFPSVDEAKHFEPQLRTFLPKLLPAPSPTSSPGTTQAQPEAPKQPEKPPAPRYILKQAGTLVFITSSPFTFKDLKPQGSKVLAEDANFRTAQNRFSSESVFLYVDFAAINKEEAEQRRKAEIEYQRIQAEAAQKPQPEAKTADGNDVPAPETPAPEAPPPNEVMTVNSPQVSAHTVNPMDLAFISLSGAFFGGRPRWPEGIGASLVFESDSYVVRVLLLDSSNEKRSPVPFFPQLIPGPALAPESPSVLPGDTELFVVGSIDFNQVYERMIDASKVQFEEMRKYSPQSVNLTPPGSPFEAYEKKLGINIKNDLLPLLGNEVAFTIPMKVLDVGPPASQGTPAQASETEEKDKPGSSPSPVFAFFVKDRETVKALIPRILESLDLKVASRLATTQKRDDTELVSYLDVVSYAFIGNFLIGSTDPKAVRHVVDSYLNHNTLSSSADFRNYTRWQPRQLLGQAYVSPALMDSYHSFVRESAAQISDQLRDFLMLVSPVPQPVTYAVSNEGVGSLHELHVPRNLLMLMVAGISGKPEESQISRNEAAVKQTMRVLASAEVAFQATNGAGRYGTVEELTEAGLVSKEILQNSNYKIGVFVSHSRFEITAVPTEYGKTGTRSFFLDESSVLRGADHGGGAATVADKPEQ
jgi:hypothetical protein